MIQVDISTFHFGNPDFTDSQPFLYPFHYHLPFVSIHDAHGNEPWWWADQVGGFRTLFVAREPTYDALVEAIDKRRTAAARFDDMSGDRLRMHGRPDVLDFVRKRQDQCQWWQGAAGETAVAAFDDMVTIAALRPAELFESGAPASGVSLRLRPRWRRQAPATGTTRRTRTTTSRGRRRCSRRTSFRRRSRRCRPDW